MTSIAVIIKATNSGMVDTLMGSKDIIGSVESLTLQQSKPKTYMSCVSHWIRPKIIYRY